MSFFGKIFGKKKKVVVAEPVKEVEQAKPVAVKEEAVAPVVKEEAKAEVVKEAPVKAEVVKEAPVKPKVEEVKPEIKTEPVVNEDLYEIRTHKDEGWQVIKAGASRARRRFDTQAECINYCKEMNYAFDLFGKDGKKR